MTGRRNPPNPSQATARRIIKNLNPGDGVDIVGLATRLCGAAKRAKIFEGLERSRPSESELRKELEAIVLLNLAGFRDPPITTSTMTAIAASPSGRIGWSARMIIRSRLS